ncbi:DNA gyrase subunit A [compost metagenome]
MLISDQGTLVRTRVDEVRSLGRNTQGVILIKLASDETVVGLERVQEPTVVDDEVIDGEIVEGEASDENQEAGEAVAEEAPQASED